MRNAENQVNLKDAKCIDSLHMNIYTITSENGKLVFKDENGKICMEFDAETDESGNQIPALPFGNEKSYSELLQEKDSQIFKLILENRELKAELDEMFSDLVDMDRKLTKVYRRNLFQRIVNKRV